MSFTICCNQKRCYDIQTEEVIKRHKTGDRVALGNYGLKEGKEYSVRDIILNFVFLGNRYK